MSSFNNNQVNKLFPGLGKIMQGYTGSLNSEASVYGHSQPAGPSASTNKECVLSPASSSMALVVIHMDAVLQARVDLASNKDDMLKSDNVWLAGDTVN
ncbi:hypothetical protein DSO57_1016694 [Entomophthora muscae]|uniref:Uncharacterized protein n=1 Tax=Entomophthora muscae TaxID=34485 RepID=A0ACC2RJB9_9FUNG|nr:hypothetical protein DSO57_1016694 [Entomophthora muscae]